MPDFARERRLVDHEVHGQRRLFDVDHFQRLLGSAGSQMVSPMEISAIPDITTISPAFCLLDRHPLESSVYEYLIDLLLFDLPVSLGYRHRASRLDNTFCDPADPQSSDVIIISQSRDLQLQRFRIAIRVRLACA